MRKLALLAAAWYAVTEIARRLPESRWYDDSTPDRLADEQAELS